MNGTARSMSGEAYCRWCTFAEVSLIQRGMRRWLVKSNVQPSAIDEVGGELLFPPSCLARIALQRRPG